MIQYFTVDSLRGLLTEAGFEVQNVYAILKGELARQEFQKRILGQSYRYRYFLGDL